MMRALTLLVVLTASLAQAQRPVVRLHHAHYVVEDPSAAMARVAASLGGSRVVAPGLGVGVRSGRELVLFDRGEHEPSVPFADAFDVATGWLASRGMAVALEDALRFPRTAVASLGLHHLGFVADDFEAVVKKVDASGARAVRRTADAVLYDTGGPMPIEILRDTDRPDAFWCPMHPDVRGPQAGKCPLCGMDLVPIPPPVIGEYRLDIGLEPARPGAGLRRLRFAVRTPDGREPVRQFLTVHEKTFHLFVISRDLAFFDHVHPEPQPDGTFVLTQTLPPGEYMLIADFLPEGGTPQMVQKAIVSPGRAAPRRPVVGDHTRRTVTVDGLTVTLESEPLAAGKETLLTFRLADAKSGVPVADLQPYLGAPAHMLVVRADLTDAIHAHPEEQATAGPVVSFHPLVPAEGDYRLWVQFQRQGRVITVPFALRAAR